MRTRRNSVVGKKNVPAPAIGVDPAATADWLARGERLYRAHHNAGALEAYERALEVGLTGKSQRRALRQRAHTLFRMRRYRTAVTAFADLPESPERDLWHARSLARSDRVPEAIEAFEELAASHRGEVATRATFLAGLLLAGRGFAVARIPIHAQVREEVSLLAPLLV